MSALLSCRSSIRQLPSCTLQFSRCLSTASSTAPAARPAPSNAQSSSAPTGRIPMSVFKSKMQTPEQDMADYYRMQRKNALLGILLAGAAAGIWSYSVHVVNDVKETFTSPEVQQIEAELEREDRQAQKQQN